MRRNCSPICAYSISPLALLINFRTTKLVDRSNVLPTTCNSLRLCASAFGWPHEFRHPQPNPRHQTPGNRRRPVRQAAGCRPRRSRGPVGPATSSAPSGPGSPPKPAGGDRRNQKASPPGRHRPRFSPAEIAANRKAGAACLSVLTDRDYFQGARNTSWPPAPPARCPSCARTSWSMPGSQKPRAMGADCILLIAAALDLPAMQGTGVLAHALGLAVLVECSTAPNSTSPCNRPPLVGINNRNLRTFEVSSRPPRPAPRLPAERIVVTESGIPARPTSP